MDVDVYQTEMPGVRILVPQVFADDRGFFMETYHQENLAAKGINLDFVQDNHARSRRNVVRGLHYQAGAGAQWRLIRCDHDVPVFRRNRGHQYGFGNADESAGHFDSGIRRKITQWGRRFRLPTGSPKERGLFQPEPGARQHANGAT